MFTASFTRRLSISAVDPWRNFLLELQQLLVRRGLIMPRIFISYAWYDTTTLGGQTANTQLQARLTRLRNDLLAIGIEHVFLDIVLLAGAIRPVLEEEIRLANFILPIATPRYYDRVQNYPTSNVRFEYDLIQQKFQQDPRLKIVLRFSGGFTTSIPPDLQGILAHDFTCEDTFSYHNALINLSPVSLFPFLFNLREGDAEYTLLLRAYRQQRLNNLGDPNPNFVSRTKIFETLDRNWGSHYQQCLTGLPGSGKAQLALHYGHFVRGRYQLIHWLNAQNIDAGFKQLAQHLGIEASGISSDALVAALQSALVGVTCLLILHQITDEVSFRPYITLAGPTLHLLLTTRSTAWSANYSTHLISEFTEDEALQYLRQELLRYDAEEARKIFKELGRNPFTLFWIASYVQTHQITLADYLDRFHASSLRLLSRIPGIAPIFAPVSANAAPHKAIQLLIEALPPNTYTLLGYLSYLSSEGIARSALENLLLAHFNQMTLDTLLLQLGCLITHQRGLNPRIICNRFVQTVVRDHADPLQRQTWFDAVVIALATQLSTASLPTIFLWQSHAQTLLSYITEKQFCRAPSALASIATFVDPENYYQQGLQAHRDQRLEFAAECYQIASDLGHVKAKHNLAFFYYNGLGGLQKNNAHAFNLFEEAALAKYPRAMFTLAECYRQGHGTTRDIAKARQWYEAARTAGYDSDQVAKSLREL